MNETLSAPVHTTCPYCGVGCGVTVTIDAGAVGVTGDARHPANAGRLCSKGSALAETVGLEGRLLQPQVAGRSVDWDEAMQFVADRFMRIIAEHGPDAVAFYLSGQLLTEDYYVANKLMKGYIGSANIDTNSRLCMSSAVAAHKRAFGEDLVPVSYADLERADLIVLVGSNTAWCHPVLYQRLVKAKQERPSLRIVVIDPRVTPTCDIADLHLPIQSGSDVWVFNGLLQHLRRAGATDREFVDDHTANLQAALTTASAWGVPETAQRCGVTAVALAEFYHWFAATAKVVTLFSQGVNQSSCGTDKGNSIINCHLLTGRIGKPGAGPFSITGQPNAMGGREVGGMASMLAAHMDLESAEHRDLVQGFWRSPRIAADIGLKAVDMFEAVHAGKIKAIWIAGTNPAVSLPNAQRAREALRRCELVVVADCVVTDTTALAHVLLPAAAWGEKEGTVTNSERCISRQRAFLPVPAAAKPDWWMFCQLAQRIGYAGFDFRSPRDIFVEHAQLSATDNAGRRAFDIGALAGLSEADYQRLQPLRWPAPRRDDPAEQSAPLQLFADGRFFHADGRARFVAVEGRAPVHAVDEEFPLVLNTGRIRDQWHTMTRTGRSARLMAHNPEPFVDMHADDARHGRLRAGEFVRVTTRWGSLVARLRSSGDMPRGTVFVPMHWSAQFSSDSGVGALVNPAVDPVSGEPEFKHTPVRVTAYVVAWQAFLLTRTPRVVADAVHWSSTVMNGCFRYELAGRRVFGDWSGWARALLQATHADADWLEYVDQATGVYRAAFLVNERIEACVYVSPRPDLPSREWLASLFAQGALAEGERAGLLRGHPADARADAGPVVCSCFGVGRNTICAAIRERGLHTAQQLGQLLRAGTNCGSCLPELRGLLHAARRESAPV